MEACRAGDLEKAIRLIKSGADVNATNANGTTPLMFAKTAAFGSGDLRILNLLIASGADINAKDKHNKTALDYTVERSQLLIKFLSESRTNEDLPSDL